VKEEGYDGKGGHSLAGLRPQATKRLRKILNDEDESSAVVAQTALAVHKVSHEIGEDESGTDEITPQDVEDARFQVLRIAEHAARLGSRFGPRVSELLTAELERFVPSPETAERFPARSSLKRLLNVGSATASPERSRWDASRGYRGGES
jgi:hypothetical protein